jgi:hypothetical protein
MKVAGLSSDAGLIWMLSESANTSVPTTEKEEAARRQTKSF